MKRGLFALCVLFLALSVSAQTPPPKSEFFLIHEEIARPSMLMQYDSVTREFLKALTDKNADPKTFGMSLFVTPDFHYLYVIPISNWAAIDTMQQGWMSLSQSVGKERWQDLMNRGNAAMSSYNEYVVKKRPDLSYVPATPRLKPEERRFSHWMFYYLDTAHLNETEQVAKDYAALFKSKNVGDPFTVYEALSGNDLPLWIVSVPARSAADFYANDERVNAMLGADVRPLQARAMANTRKFEIRNGVYHPEMSYPMPAPASPTK